MINLQPSGETESFERVTHQGKTITVGDEVQVNQAGQQRVVIVSSITRQAGHYWVGYDEDAQVCPWPLVKSRE
jgi:hypothetical protein